MNKEKQDEDNKGMSANMSSDNSPSPFLKVGGDDNMNHGEEETGWRKKVLDVEETKKQIFFSLPMILTNVFYFAILLVSVMFSGRLGELQLAGATLANSWASVTGFTFMVGLSGALETLCGQGFGAKTYRILGVHLQASCIISFFFSIIISIIWFFAEPILLLLHQDPSISKQAALYVKYLIPGLFAFGFLQNILRFLQTQSIVVPLVFFSAIPMVFHFGIAYALVHRTSLGFKGASMAASISLWILLDNCANTQNVTYMITYGLSAAASTRVSNELGAGNLIQAKNAMATTLKLCVILALIVILALVFGHNIWAGFFSDSTEIINKFASFTPLLAITIALDSVQGVLSGVTRGCGWQHLAMWANLSTFYLIGMPIAAVLGFKLKLYAKGLWIGLICGFSCQASMLLLITRRKKWIKLDVAENKQIETSVVNSLENMKQLNL